VKCAARPEPWRDPSHVNSCITTLNVAIISWAKIVSPWGSCASYRYARLHSVNHKVFALISLLGLTTACQSANPTRRAWTTGDPGAPPEVAAVYRAVLDEIFPRSTGPGLILIDQMTEPHTFKIDPKGKTLARLIPGFISPFGYRIPITFIDSATRQRLWLEVPRANSLAHLAAMTSALYHQGDVAPYINQYPGAWGRISLGRVVFNSRRSSAVVHVGFFGFAPYSISGDEFFRVVRHGSKWSVIEPVVIKAFPLPSAMLYGLEDSSQIPPPPRHWLKVTLRDSVSGAAIPAFAIRINASRVSKAGIPDPTSAPEPWSQFFTDSAGEVLVRNPPRGELQIEATCPPVIEVQGATLAWFQLNAGVGIDTTIDLRIPLTRCAELAPIMASRAASHKRDVERAKAEAAARAVQGNWWGMLRDARTGQPVPRAWIRVGDRGGAGQSDSTGHFWLWGFAPGPHKITIYCPIRRQWFGKVARTINFVARPAMKDTADISVSLNGCADVPVDTVSIRTRGVWSLGFEDGFFTPCHPFTQIQLGGYRDYGQAYLQLGKDVVGPKGGWPDVAPNPQGSTRIFLDVEADLIGPGSYGHLGVGTFLMRVTRVISARPVTAKCCTEPVSPLSQVASGAPVR
jgi:hypothetical protein